MERRENLPPLTGLRFVAAFCVLLAHLMPKAMPFPNAPTWYQLVGALSGMGMTLFFVLSGFVIHYNYATAIEQNASRGIFNFFVARFARLYPMYFVVLVCSLFLSFSYASLPAATSEVLPYYLLMAQSWIYWPVGNYGLIYELGLLPTIAWSISTEWFFYLSYPLAWIALVRLRTVRSGLWAAGVLCVVALSLIGGAIVHGGELNAFGNSRFGVIADEATRNQYTFYRWLVYFSPYARIFEFLLGCICASIYVSALPRKVTAGEQRFGSLLFLAAVAATAALHWVMFGPGNGGEYRIIVTSFHMAFGFAPLVAIIIFCSARYDNIGSRILSFWPLVICGEASYSLYLLHPVVVMAVRWEAAPVSSALVAAGDALRLTVAALAAIGLSLVTWRTIEVPARRWLRNALLIRTEQPEMQSGQVQAKFG